MSFRVFDIGRSHHCYLTFNCHPHFCSILNCLWPICFWLCLSACYLMIMDAMNSMFGKRSTSFAAQFNYKRTFKTNVSLLISFSNLVSLFCLADVFSLYTHLAILKHVHNRAHFLNKSAQICKLLTWHSALQLQQPRVVLRITIMRLKIKIHFQGSLINLLSVLISRNKMMLYLFVIAVVSKYLFKNVLQFNRGKYVKTNLSRF